MQRTRKQMPVNKYTFSQSFFMAFVFMFCSLLLSGCGEQICAYCGDEKHCTEYDILGTTRYICDDCLNNPASNILSGSVIQEYAAEPISVSDNIPLSTDYFTAENVPSETISVETAPPDNLSSEKDSSNELTNPGDSANDTTTDNSDLSGSQLSSESETSDTANQTNSTSNTGNVNNTSTNYHPDYNSIIAALNNTYVSAGLQLVPENDSNSTFGIYNGGSPTGVRYVFTNATSNAPSLSVQSYAGASSSNYSTACINAILAYLGSDDYNGLGYEIYNSASEYGNYSHQNCHFYFFDYSSTNPGNDSPIMSFEISQ